MELLPETDGVSEAPNSRADDTRSLAAALERERLLTDISRQVRSRGDLRSVLDAAVAQAGRAVGALRAWIRIDDAETDRLEAEWTAPGAQSFRARPHRLATGNLAVREARTVAVSDVRTAAEYDDPSLGGREALLESGALSALATPITLSGRVVGVLGFHREEPGPWSPGEIELAEGVAREAGLAIHLARLLEETEQRLAQAQALFEAARVVTGELRLEAVLERLVTALTRLLHADAADCYLLDAGRKTLGAVAEAAGDALGGTFAAALLPNRQALRLVGSRDLPKVLAEGLPHRPVEALEDAARDGRVLAARDIASDDRFDPEWRDFILDSGARALLAIPLGESAPGPAGRVVVFFANEHVFTDDDLELARNLAAAAAGALERSALFEAERSSRALAQHLARISGLLAPELDPALVLHEVAREAPALVGADACVIYELKHGELVATAAAGADALEVIGSGALLRGSPAREVLELQAPLVRDDVQTEERDADQLLAAGYRAHLSVPLTAGDGGVRGVISVYTRRARTWRPDEVDALVAVSASASAALANAHLYQRVAFEKERNDAILAAIADGIVATDAEGRVVLWNAAAERATGVPAGEALGRRPADVLQRELALDGDAPRGDRAISISRGGQEVWLSLTEAIMNDAGGGVAGRVFAFRDISAERLVEQMKSDFVATVSHELRTPLTSIYGFSATLLRSDVTFDDEERTTFLRYIASESERLTRILDALLHVARLESGDLDLQLSHTSVGDVVREVVAEAETASRNGHTFVVELPPELVAVRADGGKLKQVLDALVDNAVKYSPNGGSVTITARERTDAVELRVVDQGIGIAPGEQPRVFTKFYRGTGARSDGERGPGLSLFIARGLVTAMGGRISVSSVEGKGSSFVVELPVA